MEEEIFVAIYLGKRGKSLVRERLDDVLRGKCTYLGKKKEKNVKLYVKF